MLYPKMTFADFLEKKSSIPFTSITIHICLTCYMKIQKNAQEFNRVSQY